MKIKLLVSTKVELKGSKVRKLQSGGETIEVINEVGKKLIDDGRAIDPSKNVVKATDDKEVEALKAEIETLKKDDKDLLGGGSK